MGHKEFKRGIAEREQALLEYSMKLVNDQTKAEMLVQETVNLAIEEYKKYDGCENRDGRLVSIMHNQCTHALKKLLYLQLQQTIVQA